MLERLLLIELKALPMVGPRTIKTAMTIIATKTRIKAYSIKPWPFSLGVNNIAIFSFLYGFLRKPEISGIIVHPDKISRGHTDIVVRYGKEKNCKCGQPH